MYRREDSYLHSWDPPKEPAPLRCRYKPLCCFSCRGYSGHLFLALALEERPATPVEAGVDVDVPRVRLLAAPLGGTTDADIEVCLCRSKLLGEETAVGTETETSLLEVSSLELDASALVHAEKRENRADEAVLAVDIVLVLSVGGAEGGVERTGESLLAHAVRLLVVELLAARQGIRARRRGRRRVSLLVVTVRADHDNLEAILALTNVGSSVIGDVLTPDGALEAGNGVGVVARALAGVPLGVSLNEDVETGAGAGTVTVGRAGRDVVAGELLVSKVTAARD
jgi:hypothetical protein